MKRLNLSAWLFFLASVVCAQQMPESGLRVEITATSPGAADASESIMASEPTAFGFRISGSHDGGSLAGLHPGAWIRPRLEGRSECRDAIRNYLTVGPNASQDIDLNSYSFITLNADDSVGVIDPKLNLASANLLGLNKLPHRIGDWHLSEETAELTLTLPDRDKLSVLNALDGSRLREIDLPVAAERFAPVSQANTLWVYGDSALMVIAVADGELLHSLPFSAGKKLLAADPLSEQLFIYNTANGELIAIDSRTLQRLWQRTLPYGLSDLAYSTHADRLYLGSAEHQRITTLFPGERTSVDSIAVNALPRQLHASPDGHWLFALDPENKQVAIIDTASSRPVHHLMFKHGFDQLVFSDLYGYLHHTSSANVSLIHLPSLTTRQTPSLIEVPFGVKPPGEGPSHLPLITPLPEGGAVMVANPADKTLYLYMEDGMLAPANAFKVYSNRPVSLLVHDKSLNETSPGVYQTVAAIPRPGEYEVVFYLANPLLVSCQPLSVRGAEDQQPVEAVHRLTQIALRPSRYQAGTPAELKLEMDPALPNQTIQLLLMKPGSNWQRRIFSRSNAKGELIANLVFPRQGEYLLGIEAKALGISMNQSTMQRIEVTE